jgi:hypothetical protein
MENPALAHQYQATHQTLCVLPPAGSGVGPLYLMVVSDSDQTPIVGANVTATGQVTTTSCNGSQTTTRQTVTFTTTKTEWHQLDTSDVASYSIVVTYSGHSYNFTARVNGGPIPVTCATLYPFRQNEFHYHIH